MANTFFEMKLPNGKVLKLVAIMGANLKSELEIQISDDVDFAIARLSTKQVKQLRNGLGDNYFFQRSDYFGTSERIS